MRRVLFLWALFPFASLACTCQLTLSVCNQVAANDYVFVGTVEAIEPSFLDSWNAGQRAALDLLNEESARAAADRSPAAFAKLRDAYLQVFPDLPAEHKKRIANATSPDQLANLFYWILDHGKRVRLRVRTLFRGEDDNDKGDAKLAAGADKEPLKVIELWTAFGDCGINFQNGETYLVYADDDEETHIIATGSCTRTRRLTDAGDDLAYLYFYKESPAASGRVEGFVTADLLFQRNYDTSHYTGRIDAPVASTLELKSDARARYAETDSRGRFVFDGLPPGDFSLTPFAPGYPAESRQLAPARNLRLDKGACLTPILVAPPPAAPRP
ncbi:MAG: carboxypeptidase-like regulatory domain-containing protein [Candidatus Solibacter sp.]